MASDRILLIFIFYPTHSSFKKDDLQSLIRFSQILPSIALLLIILCCWPCPLVLSQCTNGTQPECKCATAPILCTIDQLDGYTFSMAAYQHPNDGPSPICPGANMSQTNNPTWFAFTAWCTNLSLRVTSTNCHAVGGAIGFQLAIYTDCTFNHLIACNADINDCNTNAKILNLTGLNIGSVYYFMVDGCLGSYCTVTIDIIGVCGQEHIEPWSQPISGNMDPCIGNTETYTVEDLDGARIYHWFLDGTPVAQTTSQNFSIPWTTAGTYELCVDASNDPCVDVSDPPAPLCSTITVHEANAGVLNIDPPVICAGSTVQISSSGYTSSVGNTQMLLITDVSGKIIDVINAPSGTYTSFISGGFTVYAYNYVTGQSIIPIVGGQISSIDCSSSCCDLESQSIVYPNVQAIVTDITCDDNGTGSDTTDDVFTFHVLVTGFPAGMHWRSSDGTIDGVYGTVKLCGPYFISGGTLYFDLHDYDVPNCATSITVDPPLACSFCIQSVDAGSASLLNCKDTLATLTGIASETGLYHWTGPNMYSSDSLSCVVRDSGWYVLRVDFGNQCISMDSVYVSQDLDAPIANAGPDQQLDCMELEDTLDASGSTGINMLYQWTNLAGQLISKQFVAVVNTPGTYVLKATNSASGCADADSVLVDQDIVAPVANAGADQQLDCNHAEVTLDASGSSGSNVGLQWIDVSGQIISTQSQIVVDAVGMYVLQVTNSINGCTSFDTAWVAINQYELGVITVLISDESCAGDEDGMIEVMHVPGGTPPFIFSLNGITNNSTGIFDHLPPGVYDLHISDVGGCAEDTTIILLEGVDLKVNIPDTIVVKEDQVGAIHAIVNVAETTLREVHWYPSEAVLCDTCLSTFIRANKNQTLSVTVIDANGCIATDQITIIVLPAPDIYIPNTFSPNDDGINDRFTVYTNDGVLSILEINIYDRWGDHLFHAENISTNDESHGWDGKFHQKEMSPGVFVYIIKVSVADGTAKLMTGDVTLVR